MKKDQYFNIPISERKDYLDLMKRYGAELALAGHLHEESIVKEGSLSMITTSSLGKALGQTPVGFRIFDVHKAAVWHYYLPLDQIDGQNSERPMAFHMHFKTILL